MPTAKSRSRYSNGQLPVGTLAERAYLEIRHQILDAELRPGSVVSERALAERLELGKAPIRAALVRLASEGLVSIAPRQGILISTPSIQDIIELFEIRVAIELHVVRGLAGRLGNDEVQRIRDNLDAYRSFAESGDAADSVPLDFEFHRLLCELHGNRQMQRVLGQTLDSLYREIRLAQSKFPLRIQKSIQEHEAVATAVIEGDAGRAEAVMRTHLEFGQQFVLSRGKN
jgi:DNA-binding GntR family transcriptional regulator